MHRNPLNQPVADPRFAGITYRRGASGKLNPTLEGTNLRVQTLVIAVQSWKRTIAETAADYDLTPPQVEEALAFYAAHRAEIDRAIADERALEAQSTAIISMDAQPEHARTTPASGR